ncbi:purine catabolism regulator [Paenibacillus phyllosphaerae]|uniref:Purine catabolism regulator n=1 Tax=Paenibacillus phyllosphaerae TaxID=274593 RepID=A0A7W5FQQ3_9BACL|nr:PucR family transcriptional regulator [Paenibacillus phyllosphaerae]MBB3113533.1 purine catabolism regulator [Paenibacillus phyllosphaerae]
MKRPVFKEAKMMAGKKGMDRIVKWVHILEITHVAPYVSKDDLILSTGLWMKEQGSASITYLEQLIRQEASGLCIELGTTIDAIPEEIVAYCEAHHFPLIVFDKPVRFVKITQDIHGVLINQQHQRLKSLEQFSRLFQKLTLATTDISAVLRLLHEFTTRQVVYYSHVETNRFYPKTTPAQSHAITAVIGHHLDQTGSQLNEPVTIRLDEQQDLMLHPIICFDQTLAYIGTQHNRHQEATDTLVVMLDYAAQSIGTMLLRTLFKEEKIQRDQSQLILELMERRIHSEEEALARLGLRVRGKETYLFACGVLELLFGDPQIAQEQKESDFQDFVVLLRALIKKQGLYGLLAASGNRVYLLFAKDRINDHSYKNLENALERLSAELNDFAASRPQPIVLRTGVGRFRSHLLESDVSYREAMQAMEVARDVPAMQQTLFYDRMGIYQLLKAIPEGAFYTSFIDTHLGVLIAHDRDHSFRLIETLDAYFKCSGSKQDTANRLFIHRQTLYHRLGKLNEILGEDFFQPQRRICLEMALLMYHASR